MRVLLIAATTIQMMTVVYCTLLLRRHRGAASAWLCLLGAMLSMLVWRIVVTTGVTPGLAFNTTIAIWGSVCAVLAMFFFSREVAQRERAEAERDRLLSSERAARSDAERASRIKDQFLATLSHELRTPLAAILGWCSIVRSGRQPVDIDRAAEVIERNARIQARLVDDLLDATRMQAGALHLERLPLLLDGPVGAALQGARPMADAKGVALHFQCIDPVPTVVGDANRLQQVASNLIVNAVKFTPTGGNVRVSLSKEHGHAVLTVADDGVGIDPAFLPKVFEPFRQEESGNARRHGGLGLGLSIAFTLVQLHQGEIRARSEGTGRGATFVVRLPLLASPVQQPSGRAVAAVPDDWRLDDVRIVLVDDERDVRSAVAGLLEQSGATVLALESGLSLEAAIAEFHPDVLVLDIGMPGEDGHSLIRRIRRRPGASTDRLPAISLTAHARDEDRAHAIESGFQAHLAKPVAVPLLVATIRRLVEPRRSSAIA